MGIVQDWATLEDALRRSNRNLLDGLNPPASIQQIRQLEQLLGVSLPKDFVACLRIHNGQLPDAPWIFDGWEYLSTSSIAACWSLWQRLANEGVFRRHQARAEVGVRDVWWSPRWVPITFNGSGDHDCLDLDPAPGGKPGQIIRIWHDDEKRQIIADSFAAWLSAFHTRLD